ncbi:hypothetical protein Dimus_017312 [Dionaea muscipula]
MIFDPFKLIFCFSWLSKEEREEKFKNFLLDRAQIAVKLYNKALDNKDKELELVDALACQTYLLRGIYYHLNFTAKPKDGPDEETKRYFAEFKRVHNDDGVLTKICPVEPKAATSNAEIHYGCAACYWAYEIYHPPDKEFNIACQKF